ncbi:MAG: rhodanese-like domain-containing protein [Bradyrhizobium sp.]|nr:MAG: rhodanese-like domain-containing protein [Bradyrhizobium sp.]
MSFQRPADYAGELSVGDAYALLSQDEKATLVDVRTKAEWAYVGVPDLSALGKTPILLEWQTYPSMQVAADFTPRLIAELTERGVGPGTPALFLCRSGVRSLAAARALASAGWRRCYNVTDGFEGGLDASRRRGALGGWRAGGLPWTQS